MGQSELVISGHQILRDIASKSPSPQTRSRAVRE